MAFDAVGRAAATNYQSGKAHHLQFPFAVASGLIMAVTGGVFGVFLLLRRMVFSSSIALSEYATGGIAAAA